MPAVSTPKPEDKTRIVLHYAPLWDSFGLALCGVGAPAGGWFGEKNKGVTERARAAGAPVCSVCRRAYDSLPAGGSSRS